MTPCWIWGGRRDQDGYARRGDRGVHRIVYEMVRGPIPEGLTIDHLCRVRHCINPTHMEPVPRSVNTLRGIGPTAVNHRKTECINGHPFDEANTYRIGSRRQCRSCNLRAVRAYKLRRSA